MSCRNISLKSELLHGMGLTTKAKGTQDFKNIRFKGLKNKDGKLVTQQLNLILPTSLCSGQIARLLTPQLDLQRFRMIADRLNNSPLSAKNRFVALPHTEGCGASNG